ncbi:MAG: hypothetical protein NTY19_13475 [Planctomycetota bacterium]|nr:hypothetical protein [Planctomycetota bacterium]
MATWHWHQKESPFRFHQDTPPVFLVHASNDVGAPIDLPRAIRAQLEPLGVPVHLDQIAIRLPFDGDDLIRAAL